MPDEEELPAAMEHAPIMHAEQDDDAAGDMPVMDAPALIMPPMHAMHDAGSALDAHAEHADIVVLEHCVPDEAPPAMEELEPAPIEPEDLPDDLEPPILPEDEELEEPPVMPEEEELEPAPIEPEEDLPDDLEPPMEPDEEELEPAPMEPEAMPEEEEELYPAPDMPIWLIIPCMHCMHAGEAIVAFILDMEPIMLDMLPDIMPDAEELLPAPIMPDAEELLPIIPDAMPDAEELLPIIPEAMPDEEALEPIMPEAIPPAIPPAMPDDDDP